MFNVELNDPSRPSLNPACTLSRRAQLSCRTDSQSGATCTRRRILPREASVGARAHALKMKSIRTFHKYYEMAGGFKPGIRPSDARIEH